MKNYTSSVAAHTTVARIEQILAKVGADHIIKTYQKGILQGIIFDIEVHGQNFTIKLPANVDAIYKVLAEKVKKPHKGTLVKIHEQATRTAWKLLQDDIEIQLSRIEMKQVEFLQVFMAYIYDGKKTFFESFADLKYLPEQKK
jgi:hypothetical protein